MMMRATLTYWSHVANSTRHKFPVIVLIRLLKIWILVILHLMILWAVDYKIKVADENDCLPLSKMIKSFEASYDSINSDLTNFLIYLYFDNYKITILYKMHS